MFSYLFTGRAFFARLVLFCSIGLGVTPTDCFGFSCSEQEVIQHVKDSIVLAELGVSKLPSEVFSVDGMSSPKVRRFLNNICSIPNTQYLEIGVWKGSTWISALYQNNLQMPIGIENWLGFNASGGVKHEFYQNCNRFLPGYSFKCISGDCFSLPLDWFPKPFNIYFYDAGQLYEDQYNAFIYYNNVLDDLFVAIVDDYNLDSVQKGTQDAFKKLQYKVLYEVFLPASKSGDTQEWWNGLYVAVVKKPQR